MRITPPFTASGQTEWTRRPWSGLGILCLAAVCAAFLMPPETALGAADETISLRGDVFSVPSELAAAKRKEARRSGFTYTIGAGALAGYDSNLYRSPDGLEEGGALLGAGLLLATDKRQETGARFRSNFILEETRYPGHPEADVFRAGAGASYSRPLSGSMDLDLGLDISHRSDDATDILGDPYIVDYSYIKYDTNASLTWRASPDHQFQAGAQFTVKDYGEAPGTSSLDWTQADLQLRYRFRFERGQYLRLWYEYGLQNYREEPSSTRAGVEDPANPHEEYVRQEARIWYSHPLSDWTDLDFSYTFSTREDQYQDYESYTNSAYRASVKTRFGEGTILDAKLNLSSREYDHMSGDGGALLAYTRTSVGVELQHRLGGALWLTGSGTYYSRDSNLSTGNDYLDYSGFLAFAGVSTYF